MTERAFRIVLGAVLLVALYFELRLVVYGYIVVLLFEGITNWRIPLLVSRMRRMDAAGNSGCVPLPGSRVRVNFEAERAMRLAFALFLIFSYAVFNKELWLIPWLSGFALLGAGLSGICPLVISFRWLGFR